MAHDPIWGRLQNWQGRLVYVHQWLNNLLLTVQSWTQQCPGLQRHQNSDRWILALLGYHWRSPWGKTEASSNGSSWLCTCVWASAGQRDPCCGPRLWKWFGIQWKKLPLSLPPRRPTPPLPSPFQFLSLPWTALQACRPFWPTVLRPGAT